MRKPLLVAITIIFVLALATVALASDPLVGTWKFNVAKSKTTDPSFMPKNETIKVETYDNGIKSTFDGVDADGKAYHSVSSAKFDGKDYPITGDPGADAIALKKIDANTFEFVVKKAGKQVSTGRVVISKDGKMQTATQKGTNPKGQEYSATWFYDKISSVRAQRLRTISNGRAFR